MAEAQLQEALQATSKELNRSVGQMAFQYRSASSRRWCCYSLALLLSMHREQQTIAVLVREMRTESALKRKSCSRARSPSPPS